jgi:hypothetical protein
MTLGLTQPLTEISTRNLPRSKERLALKDENLTGLDVSQLFGTPRPPISTALISLPVQIF